jgi:hypothetical protein
MMKRKPADVNLPLQPFTVDNRGNSGPEHHRSRLDIDSKANQQ